MMQKQVYSFRLDLTTARMLREMVAEWKRVGRLPANGSEIVRQAIRREHERMRAVAGKICPGNVSLT